MRDEQPEVETKDTDETLQMTSEIVASFVKNNAVSSQDLPELIRSVHKALDAAAKGETEKLAPRPKPAVPINKSVQKDYIVCLEDGKQLKMLRRHLRSKYNMTPEEYRQRWGLPADYPMVAPSYSETRSQHARDIGLGTGVRKKKR